MRDAGPTRIHRHDLVNAVHARLGRGLLQRGFGDSGDEVARQALAEAKLTAADIAAIGVANQRETTILWDRKSGKPLGNVLTGRIGLELRAIIAGGLAILDKIDAVQGDVFRHRPQLTKWDWLRICPGVLLHA